jgi:hypothetical protein
MIGEMFATGLENGFGDTRLFERGLQILLKRDLSDSGKELLLLREIFRSFRKQTKQL